MAVAKIVGLEVTPLIGVFGDPPLEFAGVDHRATDLVGPDTLPGCW